MAATTTPTTETLKDNGSAPQVHAPAPLATVQPKSEAMEAWELVNRKATALSKSDLVPKAYQQSPANCMIAMELAERIGCSVFMVMQNLDIIHGSPGWRGKFLIATANACGRFTALRFREEGKKGTDSWGFRAVAKDKATGEELIGPLVDWKMVKAEGWASKNGSKWLTMPELMFHYRAGAFWTRVFAPELSMGLNTAEEEEDMHRRAPPPAIAPGDSKALEAEILAEETREQVAARNAADPATGELPHTPSDEPKAQDSGEG